MLLTVIKSFVFPMSDKEAIATALGEEPLEIREVNGLYVIKVENCDPRRVRTVKEYLRKMGYGGLAKRVVFSCP